MLTITLGITGFLEIFGRDYGIEEAYLGLSMYTSTGDFYKKLHGACLKSSGLTFLYFIILCKA